MGLTTVGVNGSATCEATAQPITFKAGFGGRVAVGYDCEEPVSLWGRLYYLTRSIVRRLFQPDQVKERARRREKIALT